MKTSKMGHCLSISSLVSTLHMTITVVYLGRKFRVAQHAAAVTRVAFSSLSALKYANNQPICKVYSMAQSLHSTCCFENGTLAGFSSFEKEASLRGFALRTGCVCNPGDVKYYRELPKDEMDRGFATGKKCSDGTDIVFGKPIGVISVSFGASSTLEEVYSFSKFTSEFIDVHPKVSGEWFRS